MKRIYFCIVFLLVTAPGFTQGIDLQSLIAGKDTPHTLKLKELTADWRHMTIRSASEGGGVGDMMKQIMQAAMMSGMQNGSQKGKNGEEAMGAMMGMSLLGGLFGGGDDGAKVYYTQGKTMTIGSETFIITYQYIAPKPNMMSMMMKSGGAKEPDMSALTSGTKLTADSDLEMSLVNVKSISSLGGLRAFDMQKEIEENAKSSGSSLMDMMMMSKPVSTPATPEIKTTPAKPVKKQVKPRA